MYASSNVEVRLERANWHGIKSKTHGMAEVDMTFYLSDLTDEPLTDFTKVMSETLASRAFWAFISGSGSWKYMYR